MTTNLGCNVARSYPHPSSLDCLIHITSPLKFPEVPRSSTKSPSGARETTREESLSIAIAGRKHAMAASFLSPSSLFTSPRPPVCSTSQYSAPLQLHLTPPQIPWTAEASSLSLLSVCASRQYKRGLHSSRSARARAQAEQTTEQGSTDDEVCELVNGFEVELGEGDDTFQAYFIQAIKNNNGAGVLLLSDIYGYESDGIRDFVYRTACFGYNVLVPDLFRGNPWSDQRPKEEMESWRNTHPPERMAKDIDTATEWLAKAITEDQDKPTTPGLGLVGFCIGGGQAIQTVARDTESRYTTAVSFYGTRLDPALAESIKVPILLITGDSDKLSPVDVAKEVAMKVEGAQALVYAGRGHAFAHLPESLEDDEDAEKAFEAMRHWLHDHFLTSTISEQQ